MLGRTASANRCEISSGGSDSAMDTDAYLEQLIRKQKIPRTQDYRPSGKQTNKRDVKQSDPSQNRPAQQKQASKQQSTSIP